MLNQFGDDIERGLHTLAVIILVMGVVIGGLIGAGIYHLFGR